MGDILSQNEIDELMRQLTNGDASAIISKTPDKKEAKNYNFARPSKFSKEQLRTLEIVFENYGRMVSSFLTGYLRTATHVEVASAEQLTYNEFNNSLVNPVILAILNFRPLKGSVILEITANIGYSIIDRILGGPGLGIKKTRDFSEIEKILLERVVIQMLSYLPEPWENIMKINPKLDKLETNSQFAQIMSPNDMIALITMSIKIGSMEGFMSFCLPHIVLETIMDRLNTKFWYSSKDQSNDSVYFDRIEGELQKTVVPVRAVIGRTSITVSEFINLQVNDVIPLDSYTNSDFNVLVGNLLKFRGKPGVSRGKNAIQITTLIRKEE